MQESLGLTTINFSCIAFKINLIKIAAAINDVRVIHIHATDHRAVALIFTDSMHYP